MKSQRSWLPGKEFGPRPVWGAWNSFEEDKKGRLLPGYYADLAVLSDDIFTICPDAIKDIKVQMTMVGGKIVYQA